MGHENGFRCKFIVILAFVKKRIGPVFIQLARLKVSGLKTLEQRIGTSTSGVPVAAYVLPALFFVSGCSHFDSNADVTLTSYDLIWAILHADRCYLVEWKPRVCVFCTRGWPGICYMWHRARVGAGCIAADRT